VAAEEILKCYARICSPLPFPHFASHSLPPFSFPFLFLFCLPSSSVSFPPVPPSHLLPFYSLPLSRLRRNPRWSSHEVSGALYAPSAGPGANLVHFAIKKIRRLLAPILTRMITGTQGQALDFKDRDQGLSTAGMYRSTNTNYFRRQMWLGFCSSMVFSSCHAQVSITMSTILFEIPVHGVAHAVVSGHRTRSCWHEVLIENWVSLYVRLIVKWQNSPRNVVVSHRRRLLRSQLTIKHVIPIFSLNQTYFQFTMHSHNDVSLMQYQVNACLF